ncbi:PDDEXK-like family protein [Stutzerimonas kunmingensis]|uniref:PDDEXK-like family protein n=1 Tax=Stutzerimonas kunmingensis TaxID=1211807 RepID=UPI0005F1549C|nr:PD-(D/E)XK nuclease family protein [Stutzerimonas kunmingensis]KJS34182.1 MAG: hypothetical protein VR76_00640 [Pseudomonas sp. BRH_c35]
MDEVAGRCLERYRSLKADNKRRKQEGLHDYSLIASMLKPSNEVTLHSRFLCSMLDPNGLHYQGGAFLELFLKALPERIWGCNGGRLDPERAKVLREKGSIDILIYDGERALIIENKINAPDQPYQISRYIGCVQKKLFAGEQDLTGRLAVIYLSARRSQPSSNSMTGFSLINGMLRWKGVGQPTPHSDLPDLQLGFEIPFHHFPYFPSLTQWAESCAEKAPVGGIRNAFEEYRLVLDRLQRPKSWKKVMSLDSYAMSLDDEDQRDMYAFMVEAQTALDRFIAARLFEGLRALFGETALMEHGPFRKLDEESLFNWLTKQGKDKDWGRVGATLDAPVQPVALVLASEFAYMGVMSERPLWDEECKDANQIPGGGVRRLLRTQHDGVYRFLEYIRERAELCGVRVVSLESES